MEVEKIDSEISKLREKITVLEDCIEILSENGSSVLSKKLKKKQIIFNEIDNRYHKLGVYG